MSKQCVAYLLVAALSVSLAAIAAERGMNNEKPTVRKSEKYGLNFYYAGDQNVQEFLNGTPSVSGVWWKFHKEDADHWYGELHYPTENTGNYDTDDPKEMSPMYYMVFDLAIRKQKDLPIDLKTFRGALVLRDPKPDVPLATRGDGTAYELIGYQDVERKDRPYNFLFSRNKDLKYVPSEE